MKTRVKVTLVQETEVFLDVDHKEDEEPTDLTKEEKREAMLLAGGFGDWEITAVEVAR